ncbi:MAG: tRNA-dihydrouridine synthase DusB, partial [uncultured Frankineae bacterium]
ERADQHSAHGARARGPQDRSVAGGPPGRPRAHGRGHERRLPIAVPVLRRRALRQRDGQRPGTARDQREHDAAGCVRRGRDGPQHPALRHQPRRRGRGRPQAGRRGRRRPRRPERRMPLAEGHAPGRGSGAARPPGAVRAAGARGRAGRGRCARHRQDAQGRGRRAPDLPGGRPTGPGRGRGGRGAARAHRRAVLLRSSRLGGDHHAQAGAHQRAGARQRRHLDGRRRAPDDERDRLRRRRRRAGLPRATVAVPRPVRRLLRSGAAATSDDRRGHPGDGAARSRPGRGPRRRGLRRPRLPAAHGLVPHRLPGRRRGPQGPGDGLVARGARRAARRPRSCRRAARGVRVAAARARAGAPPRRAAGALAARPRRPHAPGRRRGLPLRRL